eukprot:SAG31_NODE_414_length_15953_cov_2.982528_13_plen_164_part_00
MAGTLRVKFQNEKLGLSLVGYAGDGSEIGSATDESCAAVVVTSISPDSEAAGLPLVGLAVQAIAAQPVLGHRRCALSVSCGFFCFFAFYLFFCSFALCSLLFALCSFALLLFCSLLFALCSLLFALCSLLFALCSLLFALFLTPGVSGPNPGHGAGRSAASSS